MDMRIVRVRSAKKSVIKGVKECNRIKFWN